MKAPHMTPTEDHGLSGARPDARDAKTQRDAEQTFTIVFRGDLAKLGLNPFATPSPFGEALRCGFGDAFDERDGFEGALQQIEQLPAGSVGRCASSFYEAQRIASSALSSEEQPSACERSEQGNPATAEQFLLNTSEVDEKR